MLHMCVLNAVTLIASPRGADFTLYSLVLRGSAPEVSTASVVVVKPAGRGRERNSINTYHTTSCGSRDSDRSTDLFTRSSLSISSRLLPLVSGSMKWKKTAAATAMIPYRKKIPDRPIKSVETRKKIQLTFWLTSENGSGSMTNPLKLSMNPWVNL